MTLISIRARAGVLAVAMLTLVGAVGCDGQTSTTPPPPPTGSAPPAASTAPKNSKDAPISNAAQDSARGGKPR